MANLTETPKWEDIYQLETSDRALGGPGGIMNKQAQQLANRTMLLKQTLDENTGEATVEKAGIVQLSNAINSNSEETAATSKAIKDAINNLNFNPSLSSSGYIKLPGGLIIQWGKVSGTIGDLSVNYPITFPNSVLQVVATLADKTSGNTSGINIWVNGDYINKSSLKLRVKGSDGAGTTAARYIAIGY